MSRWTLEVILSGAVAALDKVVVTRYRKLEMQVEVPGLNEASQTLIDKLAEYPSGKISMLQH